MNVVNGTKAVKVTQQEAINEGIVHEDNEIELYQSGRLVCAEEAFWRIIGFNMVEISPPSEQLPVILEGDETVVIPDYANEEILTEHASDVRSRINNQLQAFFELNKKDFSNLKKIKLHLETMKK